MTDNSSDIDPIKLMVVDDERDILRIIKRDLEADDIAFKVDVFIVELALQELDNHPRIVHLILTDIRMPKMNGFELYVARKNPYEDTFITAFKSG
jgi:CheY-like chemotaxis protein